MVLFLGCCYRLRKLLLLLWFRVASWENRGGGQAGSSISECLYFYTRGAALRSTANGFFRCARLISLLPASVVIWPLVFFLSLVAFGQLQPSLPT